MGHDEDSQIRCMRIIRAGPKIFHIGIGGLFVITLSEMNITGHAHNLGWYFGFIPWLLDDVFGRVDVPTCKKQPGKSKTCLKKFRMDTNRFL